jgi:stress response protein YsnF
MTEHIVAVFDSESAANAAARDMEQAGIPAAAIRLYSPAARDSSRERYTDSSTSNGGGFWAWLLGEEPDTETTRSLHRDEDFYERRAQAGETVLSVRVDDDSRIHEVVSVLEAHHPIEIEENTEEAGAAVPAGGVRGVGDAGSDRSSASSAEEVIPLAEENIEIGKRTVDRGATRVRRYVVERPVEREVTLHGERVTIERRRPLEASAPGHAFEERTVEVRETEEVPVVEKSARVVEEVAVRKEATKTEKPARSPPRQR